MPDFTTKIPATTKKKEPAVSFLSSADIRSRLSMTKMTVGTVTDIQLQKLENLLAEETKKSGLMQGTLKMEKRKKAKRLFFTCKSEYFTGREAVSFNSDSFIGVAGWASTQNSQPFLRALMRWADYLDGARDV
ncbi:MAG: hypothetical protein GY774_22835 [Planctomycetes bacterium]|nr:hypothetical protein [Planctomycetota bacterium]